MSALNQSLLTVVEILLIVTLPIIALAALQNLRLSSQRLSIEADERERKSTMDIVKTAVAAAEQTGLLDNLIGAEKKERALEIAEGFLRERGISLDLQQLSSLIEAQVLDLSQGDVASTAAAPATSSDQQDMINNAVETAVLAAEQSGVKGYIENVGTQKKHYAVNLASKFLEANGIQVNEDLLSGLIEGQLMKFVVAARGGLPVSGPR